MKRILVDGYNVINSWPDLVNIKDNIQFAREKLIEVLQNYAAFTSCEIYIVFDAYRKKGIENREQYSNLTVIYTKEGETADSCIERIVDEIGRKYEVFVVTSDSLEQQLAFQRGAVRMSSIEFYFEVKEVEEKIRVNTKRLHHQKKSSLKDAIEKNVLEKLEKIRRSR